MTDNHNTAPKPTLAHQLEWLRTRSDLRSLRVAFSDLNGCLRGKRILLSDAAKALRGEVRMPLSVAGVDIWGEDEASKTYSPLGSDPDGLATWTGRAILPVSWLSQPTAIVPVWLSFLNGRAFPGDPRRALANVVKRLHRHGLRPVVATELEFYLVDPNKARPTPPLSPVTGKRLDNDSIMSIDDIDEFDDFIDDVYSTCAKLQISADTTVAEDGIGQFEICLRHHDDPLKIADDSLFLKRAIKGVARKHNLAATFMAKPYGDRSGNSMHVHFSILDQNGHNIFDDGTERGSPALLHAIAGLLAAMPDSTLLFAPHLNSYRRLLLGSMAPSTVCWGYDNRTAAVRIPSGSPSSRRIEHRLAGADTNPYLVLAAILGTALAGMDDGCEPPPPVEGEAYPQKLPRLTYDWHEATSAFAHSQTMRKLLPARLRSMYLECKQREQAVFSEQVTDFEFDSYLEAA